MTITPAQQRAELEALWQLADEKRDIATQIISAWQRSALGDETPPVARRQLIASLSPHLPLTQLPAALVHAKQIGDAWTRAFLLTQVAADLPEPYRGMARREAATAVASLTDDASQFLLLEQLLPQLDTPTITQLLPQIERMATLAFQARLWAQVSRLLAGSQQQNAQAAALNIAWQLGPEAAPTEIIADVAPELDAELRHTAVRTFESISDPWAKTTKLAALVPHLPRPQQKAVLTPLMQAALRLPDAQQTAVLAELAPYLPAKLLLQTLATAKNGRDDWTKASLLIKLLPALPDSLLDEVWQVAQTVRHANSRARLYSALYPHLSAAQQEVAEATIRQAINQLAQGSDRTLIDLTPVVPDKFVADLLGLAPRLTDRRRLELMEALLPRLATPHLPRALRAIQTVVEPVLAQERMQQMTQVAIMLTDWAAANPRAAYEGWKSMLRLGGTGTANQLLADLAALRPFFMQLIPPQHQAETAVRLYQALSE